MEITKNKTLLESILTQYNYPCELIIHFLDCSSLVNLVVLCKQINKYIRYKNYLENKISYSYYFRLNEFMEIIYLTTENSKINRNVMEKELLIDSQLNLKCFHRQFNIIKWQLIKNMCYFLDQQSSNKIVKLYQSFILAKNIPLPKLRRQNVGIFCQSIFQVMLADYQELSLQQFQIEQLNTLKYLIGISSENISKNKDKNLYIQNSCSFIKQKNNNNFHAIIVSILKNIIKGTQIYLKVIKSMIQNIIDRGQKYKAFMEFNLRYQNFRITIVELESNFGFLFTKFGTLLFVNNKSKYKNRLWKILQQIWLDNFQEYHSLNNICYNFSIILNREQSFDKYFQQNHQNFTNNAHFLFLQHQKLSVTYNKLYALNYQSSEVCNDIINYLISAYNQYIIDISIDENTVNWCGSSEQKLNRYYKENQQNLIYAYVDYIDRIMNKIDDDELKIIILSKQLMELMDKMKPIMVKQIQKIMYQLYVCKLNPKLISIYNSQTKNAYFHNISQTDLYLNQINHARGLYQNLPQINIENSMIFFYHTNYQSKINQFSQSSTINSLNLEQQLFVIGLESLDNKQKIMKFRNEIESTYQESYENESIQIFRKNGSKKRKR